jgi:tRNA modification GTPase
MALRETLIGVAAHTEAYIDFPEEDIDPDTGRAIIERLTGVIERLQVLLASADRGRILREGARAVICGEPNVGKSSLLNVLLGFERAIVSDTAGTTRDTIEEVINLHGIPLRLIDTAGLHESSDDVERLGMQRTHDAITHADVVIEVLDGSAPSRPSSITPPEEEAPTWIRLLNKADLGLHPDHSASEGIAFSCQDRTGLEELTSTLRHALLSQEDSPQTQMVAINARHQACLKRALTGCEQARAALQNQTAPEFVALDLREAMEAIGEVVGKVDVEEILGEIFSAFCIGK